MLTVSCLSFLFYYCMYHLCCFYSIRILCYCGSVSDHLGPSALINSISFDLQVLQLQACTRFAQDNLQAAKVRHAVLPTLFGVLKPVLCLDHLAQQQYAICIGACRIPIEHQVQYFLYVKFLSFRFFSSHIFYLPALSFPLSAIRTEGS